MWAVTEQNDCALNSGTRCPPESLMSGPFLVRQFIALMILPLLLAADCRAARPDFVKIVLRDTEVCVSVEHV